MPSRSSWEAFFTSALSGRSRAGFGMSGEDARCRESTLDAMAMRGDIDLLQVDLRACRREGSREYGFHDLDRC